MESHINNLIHDILLFKCIYLRSHHIYQELWTVIWLVLMCYLLLFRYCEIFRYCIGIYYIYIHKDIRPMVPPSTQIIWSYGCLWFLVKLLSTKTSKHTRKNSETRSFRTRSIQIVHFKSFKKRFCKIARIIFQK